MLKLADTVLILINPSPSNVKGINGENCAIICLIPKSFNPKVPKLMFGTLAVSCWRERVLEFAFLMYNSRTEPWNTVDSSKKP